MELNSEFHISVKSIFISITAPSIVHSIPLMGHQILNISYKTIYPTQKLDEDPKTLHKEFAPGNGIGSTYEKKRQAMDKMNH